MKTFAERLRHALDVRGKSQHALARLLGITQGEVSRLCGGRRGAYVSYAKVVQIARALNVSAEWLGEGAGDPPTERDPLDERYPRRAEAARIARDGGIPTYAIDYVCRQDPPDEAAEWSVLRWIDTMKLAAALPRTEPPPSPPVSTQKRSHTRARADIAPPTVRSTKIK
jgi:transcriptional regulator with XRE-family HTH domain